MNPFPLLRGAACSAASHSIRRCPLTDHHIPQRPAPPRRGRSPMPTTSRNQSGGRTLPALSLSRSVLPCGSAAASWGQLRHFVLCAMVWDRQASREEANEGSQTSPKWSPGQASREERCEAEAHTALRTTRTEKRDQKEGGQRR